MEIRTAEQFMYDVMIEQIEHLLGFCTEEQRDKFHMIISHSPWKTLGKCPAKELPGYYELVRRTIISNEERTDES